VHVVPHPLDTIAILTADPSSAKIGEPDIRQGLAVCTASMMLVQTMSWIY
jgi:hypothetical protein